MKGVGLKNKAGTTQQQEEEIVPLKSKQVNLVSTKQVIRLQSPAYQATKGKHDGKKKNQGKTSSN